MQDPSHPARLTDLLGRALLFTSSDAGALKMADRTVLISLHDASAAMAWRRFARRAFGPASMPVRVLTGP